MRPPRQPGPLADPLASDASYAAATVALGRFCADYAGPQPIPATQIAGVSIAAAAPFIARDLLNKLDGAPWWRRRTLRRRLLAEAHERIFEQGVLSR